MNRELDEKFMRLAIEEAKRAKHINEVPVGAVIVSPELSILSHSHNLTESTQDPTSHAEILAIKKASRKLKSWRLINTTLYVTLEPCAMCLGAIVNSRIKRVVFGALDPKAGALVSKYRIGVDGILNHRIEYSSEVLENECTKLMKQFFQEVRSKKT